MTRPPLALAYHGVADVPLRDDPHRLYTRPADLRRDIETLRRWGYTIESFGGWARAVRDGRGADHACLTFDDATADLLDGLLPVLRDTGAPATVFAVSGLLGQDLPWDPHPRVMDADGLRELAGAGVEVGGHTVTHPDLTTLDYGAALDELRRGREELERLIERPVKVLAYPYGQANADTIRAAREAGFEAACRTDGNGSLADPLDLPRQSMGNRSTRIGLMLKREDRYERLMRIYPIRGLRRVRLLLRGGHRP